MIIADTVIIMFNMWLIFLSWQEEKKGNQSVLLIFLFFHLFLLFWVIQKAVITLTSVITHYIIMCNKTRSFEPNERIKRNLRPTKSEQIRNLN